MAARYETKGPTRVEIDAMPGPVVVQFGTDWCGHCQAAEPLIAGAFADYPAVKHLRIEDGRGRPLGRSFGVKLWPTMVFLADGREVARVTRPRSVESIGSALAGIAGTTRSAP